MLLTRPGGPGSGDFARGSRTLCCLNKKQRQSQLGDVNWEETHTLAEERQQHSAWDSPQGIRLLGGWGYSAETTSEILLENGDTKPGFNLDYWTM